MPADKHSDDTAGVIMRPPLLYLGGLAFGLGGDLLLGLPALPYLSTGSARLPALAIGLAGFALVAAAAWRFHKAGTNVPTNRPTMALVTGGLYRFSRNPIYVGLTLIYLGVTAFFASLGALILLAAVLPVMEFGVIRREERYLEHRFGAAYRDYRARVRRWL